MATPACISVGVLGALGGAKRDFAVLLQPAWLISLLPRPRCYRGLEMEQGDAVDLKRNALKFASLELLSIATPWQLHHIGSA